MDDEERDAYVPYVLQRRHIERIGYGLVVLGLALLWFFADPDEVLASDGFWGAIVGLGGALFIAIALEARQGAALDVEIRAMAQVVGWNTVTGLVFLAGLADVSSRGVRFAAGAYVIFAFVHAVVLIFVSLPPPARIRPPA